MSFTRTSKYYPLKYVVECRDGTSAGYEVIAGFNVDSVAINYAEECDDMNTNNSYRVLKRGSNGFDRIWPVKEQTMQRRDPLSMSEKQYEILLQYKQAATKSANYHHLATACYRQREFMAAKFYQIQAGIWHHYAVRHRERFDVQGVIDRVNFH